MTPPDSPEGRKLTESQLQYTAEIQAALTKRNARIEFLEAALERLEDISLREAKHDAWLVGQQHEIEHLAKTGQFCPQGEKCSPYSAQK
jgi:hypothetical protein